MTNTGLTSVAMMLGLLAGATAAAEGTLLTAVTLVDVETGTLTSDQSVLIRDGVIVEIGAEVEANDAAVLDANGRFLIPGLWDSYVHVFSSPEEPVTAFRLYLLHGVTGIRDMGALWPIEAQQDLQRQVEDGAILGPRLVLSGAWVDARPGTWPGMFLADTPDEAGAVVAQVAEEGWAAVESYSMLDETTYRALAEASEAHGLPLVGPIPERVTLGTGRNAFETE